VILKGIAMIKRFLIYTIKVLVLLLISCPTNASETYYLKITNQYDNLFKNQTSSVVDPELKLFKTSYNMTPVFKEPVDPQKRIIWYNVGMNLWYKIVMNEPMKQNIDQILASKPWISEYEIEVIDQYIASIPNDYYNYDMWALDQMQCPAAWDSLKGDGEVIIATIDTGVDIFHPDLAANIFVNPGEDLNQNGIWDDSDNNGVDDDENGYIDDISGWDFVEVDSVSWTGELVFHSYDGEDYDSTDNKIFPDYCGHGTHIAGSAAAITDNGIGISSPAWNLTSLPIKSGYACWTDSLGTGINGRGSPFHFAQGVEYAVNMGAKVISISFVGKKAYPVYSTALDYAYENNVLVFGAAGNFNNADTLYPAGYEKCIAVAATDIDDRKAGFSNFGDWIDLCAPGVSIWSTMSNTVHHPEDYSNYMGTSQATPLAAAVAALLITKEPDLDRDFALKLLKLSCDNIDDLNQEYEGLLGAGRINAHKIFMIDTAYPWPLINLTADLNDASSEVRLNWGKDLENNYDYMDSTNVLRNGQIIATIDKDSMEYVDFITNDRLHTYEVNAIYPNYESDLSNSVSIIRLDQSGEAPSFLSYQMLNQIRGEIQLSWRQNWQSGYFYELDYARYFTTDWSNIGGRGDMDLATEIKINSPARLVRLMVPIKSYDSNTLEFTVSLYQKVNNAYELTPVSSHCINIEPDCGEKWITIDYTGTNLTFDDDILVGFSSEGSTEYPRMMNFRDSDIRGFYKGGNRWLGGSDPLKIRALFAGRTTPFEINDEFDIFTPDKNLIETNNDNIYGLFNVWNDDSLIVSTYETSVDISLEQYGVYSYTVSAEYPDGETDRSDPIEVLWDDSLEYFDPVQPTNYLHNFLIYNITVDGVEYREPLEIGIYDDTLCVGGKIVNPVNDDNPIIRCRVFAWGAEDEIECSGYQEGNPIKYYGVNSEDGSKMNFESISYVFGDTTFNRHGNSSVRLELRYSYDFARILLPVTGDIIDETSIEYEWIQSCGDPNLEKIDLWNFNIKSPNIDTTFSLLPDDDSNINLAICDIIGCEYWEDTLNVEAKIMSTIGDSLHETGWHLTKVLPFREPIPEIPSVYAINSIYPNPFNSTLIIDYNIPETDDIDITIFNVLGKKVYHEKLIVNQGRFSQVIKSDNNGLLLSSGVYFLSIKYRDINDVRKILFLK
jgi:subtilisin family serine protease